MENGAEQVSIFSSQEVSTFKSLSSISKGQKKEAQEELEVHDELVTELKDQWGTRRGFSHEEKKECQCSYAKSSVLVDLE